MIYQGTEWTRFSLILITQSFISFLFFYLAFRILKRNFNRLTLTLSFFYILPGTGLFLNIIYLPLSTYAIGIILYFVLVFLILFGQIFLLIFIINLLNVNPNIISRNQIFFIIIYAILAWLLLIFPGGITINRETDWTPKYSLPFFITIYIFYTSLICIPTIIYLMRLSHRFQDKVLKRKMRYFFTGIAGMLLSIYGLILYNTWDDPIFKIIWTFLSLLVIPSGLLIYYGIGHNL